MMSHGIVPADSNNNGGAVVVGRADAELRYLLSNPPLPTSPRPSGQQQQYYQNPHEKAHAALQHLRDTGDPTFLFLRCLLELIRNVLLQSNGGNTASHNGGGGQPNADDVALMFHCVNGVRDTCLDKWDTLPKEGFLYVVRDYLLCLGIWGESGLLCSSASGTSPSSPGPATSTALAVLPRVVSTALLSTSAAFWKRCWLDIHHQVANGEQQQHTTSLSNHHNNESNNHFHPNVVQTTSSIVKDIQSMVHHFLEQTQQQQQQASVVATMPPLFQSFIQDCGGGDPSKTCPSVQLFQYLEQVIIPPIQEQEQQSSVQQTNPGTTIAAHTTSAKLQSASMGCLFLSNLLGEISGVPSSTGSLDQTNNESSSSGGEGEESNITADHGTTTRYRQPLQFHRLVFQRFSSNNNHMNATINNDINDGLDAVLALCMKSLSSLVQFYVRINQDHPSHTVMYYDSIPLVHLASGIISLTTDVLSWDFELSSSTAATSSTDSSSSNNHKSVLVKPPARWRPYIVQPDFLSAIFTMYGIVRGQMSARSRKNENDGDGSRSTTFASGMGTSFATAASSSSPQHWRQSMSALSHALRQLLIQLSSVSGTAPSSSTASTITSSSIFSSTDEQRAYAAFLVEGCLNSLTSILLYDDPNDDTYQSEWREGEAIDLCCMVSRLIQNFKLPILASLPTTTGAAANGSGIASTTSNSFWGDGGMIYAMSTIANQMCSQMLRLVESSHGNVDDYEEEVQWRQEAFNYILEGANLLLEDPWLQNGNGGPVDHAISNAFGSLYSTYVTCRTKMNRIEEVYSSVHADKDEDDFDELRDEISSNELMDQIVSVSVIGRAANLLDSLMCLLTMMQECVPRLQSMFESTGNAVSQQQQQQVTLPPEAVAQLEHGRMIIVCISYLLTDDIEGEMPMIPEAICKACQMDVRSTKAVQSLVELCMTLAETQASRIRITPNDPRLSPLLGKTLVWFLHRWSVAYVLPPLDEYSPTSAGAAALQLGALSLWGTMESAQHAITFCVMLCLHYFCFWPLEQELQKSTSEFLLAITKMRGDAVRSILIESCVPWQQLVSIHIITAPLTHTSNDHDVKGAMETNSDIVSSTSVTMEMISGYKRLPYFIRGNIFSAILIGCSNADHLKANDMLNRSLAAVHGPFTQLLEGLRNRSLDPHDIRAQEAVALAVEMYRGIAVSSEMSQPSRVPQFLSQYLMDIASLMTYYASDLSICERLLQLFCDYAERFILLLERREDGIALFSSSAQLLRMYSTHHCASRKIQRPTRRGGGSSYEQVFEEEQTYNDVLCAIQLLLHLGTKDFVDMCSSSSGDQAQGDSTTGPSSNDMTSAIFLGIQDILPLMTQGLLQYPQLAKKFFFLVGYMMETYSKQACALPYPLLRSILDSMLFGMAQADPDVAKHCLMGIKGLANEQLKSQGQALHVHLTQHEPNMLEQITSRILTDVVFRTNLIWDGRLESTSMVILYLSAVDVNRFVSVVNSLAETLSTSEQKQQFHTAFGKLISPTVVTKVQGGVRGLEARKLYIEFKQNFELFIKEIHSFLIVNQ